MNELQYKMKVKDRYQSSKIISALFTTAVVKIKAEAEKAVAKQKAMSETEPVSSKAGVETKTKEPILEQKVEPEVETKAAIEASTIEPETESVEQTVTNETKSEAETKEALAEPKAEEKIESEAVEAHIQSQEELQEVEPVSQKETTETFESEAEVAEQKAKDADTAFEDVAEEKVEITAESQEPAAGEVSKNIQQMAQPQPNQPRKQSLAGSGLCAKDIMLKELVWGSPKDSVQQAITKMQQYDSGHLMVGIDGVLEGIVSNSDITGALSPYLRPVFARCRRPLDDATLQIRIKWIMSRPVHIVKPETPLANVMENMCRFGVLCLPVADQQGKVQGLVTEADIFKVLLELKSSSRISASGNEHKEQATSDHFSDHREIESIPTMEPDLVASV